MSLTMYVIDCIVMIVFQTNDNSNYVYTPLVYVY